jgi:hypothetical protein
MRLPRFSIASILAVIAIFAVALAALRNPSYLWASVTFSLALGALVVAIVNVSYGRAHSRAYWLGFSLFGGIYFAICSLPGLHDSVCPRLATEVVLDLLYPYVSPAAPTSTSGVTTVTTTFATTNSGAAPPTPISSTAAWTFPVVTFAQQPPPQSIQRWTAWNQPDRTVGVGYQIGTVSLCSSEAFRRIGHSMFTLLVAVLGGTFARYRYRIGVTARPESRATP